MILICKLLCVKLGLEITGKNLHLCSVPEPCLKIEWEPDLKFQIRIRIRIKRVFLLSSLSHLSKKSVQFSIYILRITKHILHDILHAIITPGPGVFTI